MRYRLDVKIIIKSYPRSGKVEMDNRSIDVDESYLGYEINMILVEKQEKNWESVEFEVHKQ